MEGGKPSGSKKRNREFPSPSEDRQHGNVGVGMGEPSKRMRRIHDLVSAQSQGANLPCGLGPEDMEAASALVNMRKDSQGSALCHEWQCFHYVGVPPKQNRLPSIPELMPDLLTPRPSAQFPSPITPAPLEQFPRAAGRQRSSTTPPPWFYTTPNSLSDASPPSVIGTEFPEIDY
jgi:hypothetical protein